MTDPTLAPRRPVDTGRGAYRADIDGLRALAILLVVVYHVWLGRVSGGVDVFLMVSAFFLTLSFVRRIQALQGPSLGGFWLRRFRRLLPAAAVVILAVLGVAWAVYPQTEWPRVWTDAWSSLFYVQNWNLAYSEVDYYARVSTVPSPFQHFWSLSVQGQVFLLWPLIFAAAWVLLRRRQRMVVPVLTAVFAVVFFVSLGFSIVETETNQAFAYFDTRTRLWEFAAGSLVALALPYLRVPSRVGAAAGWIGVGGIVLCGIVLDVQGGFPGYLALWPVVCTALVIVAGRDAPRGGPTSFLSSTPLRLLSRDAYALYLVHWPVLVTWMGVSDRTQPGPFAGAGIVMLSMVLAAVLSRTVEEPLFRAPRIQRSGMLAGAVVATSVLVVAAPLALWQGAHERYETALSDVKADEYPGAAQLDAVGGHILEPAPVIPVATALDGEWVSLDGACEGILRPTDPVLEGSCLQTSGAPSDEATRVLVIGDSHAQQLMSPLKTLAEEQGWEVVALLKGGCALGVGAPSSSVSGPPCDDWRRAAVAYATSMQPDAVYLVATRSSAIASDVLVEGIEDVADSFSSAGIEIIAVRDTPRFDFDMYECVSNGVDGCAVDDVGTGGAEQFAAFVERDGIIGVDFRPWLCPDGICRGSIGNIAVYIDDNHLSHAYGVTLTPMLRSMLGLDDRSDAHLG